MKVLVTGGAGYIGSTLCSALRDSGHTPVVLDSLVRGHPSFVRQQIFYQGDIADAQLVDTIFSEHPDIVACIHCAALILVPESVEKPYAYYLENVSKSLQFFFQLQKKGCQRVIFSSSAAIYDVKPPFLVTESSPILPSSPYARTKHMIEQILADYCQAYPMYGVSLRYFNPIGADPKRRSGPYDPNPSHVLAKMLQVYNGEQEKFLITGTAWPTRDGSGIRDYIHVWDLVNAHVKALESFDNLFEKARRAGDNGRFLALNLGTGRGVTVKELVKAFEQVVGRALPQQEAPPRPGDVAGAYASADKAWDYLGWKAELSLEDSMRHALAWWPLREHLTIS